MHCSHLYLPNIPPWVEGKLATLLWNPRNTMEVYVVGMDVTSFASEKEHTSYIVESSKI